MSEEFHLSLLEVTLLFVQPQSTFFYSFENSIQVFIVLLFWTTTDDGVVHDGIATFQAALVSLSFSFKNTQDPVIFPWEPP